MPPAMGRRSAVILPFRLTASLPSGAPSTAAGRVGSVRGALEGASRSSRTAQGRRILSVHLPRCAIERWLRHTRMAEEALVVLATPGRHGPVIHAATRAADEAGARPGLRVADARSACPGLEVREADLRGDAAALDRLALWSRRWCPWTAVEPLVAAGAGGLVMDITGAAHLWGGEAALLADIEARLAGLGLSARLAVAPTWGAAWALARFGGPRTICGPQDLAAMLGPLPIQALRLSGEASLLLRRMGLGTVGALAQVPRLPLARRFVRATPGDNPLLRLDQAMGRLAEPLDCPGEPPRFLARAVLSEPIQHPAPLLPALTAQLCAMLDAKGMGARHLLLALYRTDGEVGVVEAATARATRDPIHLVRLFEGRVEGIDPGFGFDFVTLGATVAERLPDRQDRLDGKRDEGESLARLLDRLAARFGPRAARRPTFHASHVPERAAAFVPALGTAPLSSTAQADGLRPLRLFDPPEEVRVIYAVPEGPPAQFVWRRITHRVVRFAGPERIAPEWWRDRPGTRARDYYRIEDQAGQRFWLYREGLPTDGRGGEPRWFMHGLFA